MSNELVVLNNNTGLVAGGLGLGSRLFKLKPATLEVVSKTTQQEGATPGRLRIRETGDQFDEMKLVMLVPPQEQREFYNSKTAFSSDNKVCFSLDNLFPHIKAKEPQGLNCKVCDKGDKNWEKWRKDKRPENLPPCRKYWHLVVADRLTQMIYYFNVKGTGITPFEQQMQNLARTIAQMEANVKAENKRIKAEYDKAIAAGATVGAPDYKPMPNIFDVTFTVTTTQETKGGPWIPQFSKFLAMKEEDRAEFGTLYMDFVSRRPTPAEDTSSTEDTMVAEAPSSSSVQEVSDVVGPLSGTIIPDQEITI